MTKSDEQKIKEKDKSVEFFADRLSIPVLKYFWQASPLLGSKQNSTHRFLRKVEAFENLSDYEVYLFSKFLHFREFNSNEAIFREGDGGFGFYLILSGNVNIYTESQDGEETELNFVTELEKYSHFGELSLLEKQNCRNATAITKNQTTLLVIYKPDLEELIERYPVVGAKFLQALSWIVSRRLNKIAQEIRKLKLKIKEMKKNASNQEIQK